MTNTANRRYWAMRQDKNVLSLLGAELQAGRLRQGWGYRNDLNLRVIQAAGPDADDDQKNVWRRQRRMLIGDEDAWNVGDWVLIPHQPSWGRWTLVEVTGEYEFSILDGQDYGHVVPVRTIRTDISPRGAHVSAGLRKSMSCRLRTWCLDSHGKWLEAIASTQDDVAIEQDDLARLEQARDNARTALVTELKHRYGDSDFEAPIAQLVRAALGVDLERDHGGRNEQGADLYARYTDPLGLDHGTVIQVKCFTGRADPTSLEPALEQIEQAHGAYPVVTGGLIVTLLDEIPERTLDAVEHLQNGLGIPVSILGADDVGDLMLRYAGDILARDETQ